MTDLPAILSAIKTQDPQALSAIVMELWGRLAMCENVSKRRRNAIAKATDPAREAVEKVTWLTPAKDAYEAVMGVASFPYGKAASALSTLNGPYTPEEIGERLGFCLRTKKRNGELQFFSFPRFVETVGTWNPNEPAWAETEG